MSIKSPRIIVFEDDPALATFLEQTFRVTGHDVHVFTDPTTRLVCIDYEAQGSRDKPCADVVLSDHIMPNMTGIDFLLLQRRRDCKIIDENKAIMTGAEINPELEDTIKELGCLMFKKPINISEILKWVDGYAERVLEKRQHSEN